MGTHAKQFLSWRTIHIISIDGNKCPIGIVLGDTSRELDLDYQSQIGNEVVHFLSRLPCWTSFVQQWKHSIFEKKIITMTCCLSLQPLIGTRVRIMRVLMNNLLSGDEQSVQHITTLETKYPNSLPHSNPCSSFTWPCQVLYWVLCVHMGHNETTLFSGRRVWPGNCYSQVLINFGINAIRLSEWHHWRGTWKHRIAIHVQFAHFLNLKWCIFRFSFYSDTGKVHTSDRK